MAIDNLNYYSAWLPAGQQTDRYSSQPWCLRSKNLDIFSSSKSVKATAWSAPTQTDADVIKQDWKLLLKTDWKVYERTNNWDVLVVDPATNFPVYKVCYTWENGTYADAQWGTVQDLVAKYEWDELKAFTVFSDRASYNWSAVKYVPNKSFSELYHLSLFSDDPFTDWYQFRQSEVANLAYIILNVDSWFASIPLRIYAEESDSDDANISLDEIAVWEQKYYYDAQTDWLIPRYNTVRTISFSWNITDGILVDIPVMPSSPLEIALQFKFTKKAWASTFWWSNWRLYIDMNWWPHADHRMTVNNVDYEWDYNAYYSYLPIRDRKLVSVWDYGYSQTYWMKGTSFQPLYKWNWSWIYSGWQEKTIYDFITDMGWETDVSIDIIGMMIWNEQVYMVGNMDWNWYIIPCDLSWWKGTPYIAYGCTFTWVANIDYLMYLVGTDRWISQLRAYNGQELVKVIWWNEETSYNDIINIEEQYKFDWKIVKYRWNLILSTSDNRIFQYWQTYGGKGWTFIHEIPWTINELVAEWNDLRVKYSVTSGWTTTKYLTTYQDDTPIKNYNTEWMAEYPIVIWNHLLEKEESDLYCSYILPSSSCSIELWGCANHYHFWTFKVPHTYTPPTAWSKWDIQWLANGGEFVTNRLEFIEKNGDYYTFRLVGDFPVMSGHETWKLEFLTKTQSAEMTYTEVHHYRKIWEITADKYTEWEFRFTNLNNKLELPKSHSLQIMVKGKGTAYYTPELFALDLVANQRERW